MGRTVNDKNVLRASILAINDGLCSNFNFIMGVIGAGATSREIVLTGMVGIIAGSFSMGMGEWLSLSAVRDSKINSIEVALYSFAMFIVGASIPIAPFLFMASEDAIINAAVVCGCAMFTVGVVDGKRDHIKSGIKHVLVGLAIAGVTHICSSFIPDLLGVIL